MREFFAWYLDKKCLDSKISKMPRHTKAWNSSVLYRKTKNPFEPKICLYKGFKVL